MSLTVNEALAKRELDYEPFITGKRHKPGIGPAVRKQMASLTEKFLFCYFDSELGQQLRKPPAHVQVAFDEVFGSRKFEGPFGDGKENLRLVEHPILARWCVVQRVRDQANEDYLWQVVRIFSSADEEDLDPEYIPSDYEQYPILHHLAGLIGEHRLPDRRDFEALEKFDQWRYGKDAIQDMLEAREAEIERQLDSEHESFEHDFVSYHAHLIADEANQRAGSMQKTWLVMEDYSERLRVNPKFYKIEQRKGYKIRRKRTKQEWSKFVREAYRHDKEFKAQIEDEAGMDKDKFQTLLGLKDQDPLAAHAYKVPESFFPETEEVEQEQMSELRKALGTEIQNDVERAKQIFAARATQKVM